MNQCMLCDKEGTIKYYDPDNELLYVCPDCAKNLLNHNDAVLFRGDLYSRLNPDITTCYGCGGYVHKEMAAIQDGRCLSCAATYYGIKSSKSWIKSDSYAYCNDCHCIHKVGMCPTGLSDTVQTSRSLKFSVRNESKSWDAKGRSYASTNFIRSIGQFQIERDLRQEYKEELERFYRNGKKFDHYYTREPINIEGEVKYYNYQLVSKIKDKLDYIRSDYSCGYIEECRKIPKYYNYYIKGIDENGLIKWQFIDLMGNIRERSESINKFLQEIGENPDNSNMFCSFKYRLSSDIKHKVDAFKLNEKVGSCQKSGNCDSYARGAYDAITNGCNCPLLIYTPNDKLIARITTRIMYDTDGQEYILIDRIYHSGEFSDSMMKGEIYKAIVKDLKDKGYKVIASPYSAHDSSTYAYLSSLGMKSVGIVTNLCQPLRRLIGSYGYYCDGGTEVRQGDIDGLERATDYLDKAYLF